ncbi:hypothetical protein CC86DRAFT_372241 [Ophiobolus disseminans]|uniref:RING-type E3 ubiquitin transferase n=1 Tax=Ophiobolus disseminans TaxID=1469910 RepID=A0A6A6ZQ29_9PLEO|nr:hypothetical protein CC86DRAFT_372241 [Ophiobolus disseminans]
MRPLRLLLSAMTSFLVLALLFYVTLGSPQDEQLEQNSVSGKQGGFKALFSFTSPGSLFPPSAIISLTDDNSTFFLARPAAFGPSLPKDGLSSPLWIGSGFGDDAMGKGELGCGDNLDWDDHDNDLKSEAKLVASNKAIEDTHTPKEDATAGNMGPPQVLDDGTDDHLHASSSGHASASAYKKRTEHSDIQSLQESAEIEGKVVLLKRGGCGFLAKVLWAQKRGAVAVIVGDDVRGGGLIRMYAKGDTSNVTISSLFTSHTTAHLLSSLLPGDTTHGLLPGNSMTPDAGKEIHDTKVPNKKLRPTASSPRIVPTSSPAKQEQTPSADDPSKATRPWRSWLDSVLSRVGLGGPSDEALKAGSRRPPASGDLDGLESEDWDDDLKPIKTRSSIIKPTVTPALNEFTIGKQDWRDADLLFTTTSIIEGQTRASSAPLASKTGGGVLPGSGEYPHASMTDIERKAWWHKWFGSRDDSATEVRRGEARSITSITDANLERVRTPSGESTPHEGLWVTLTPTNVSTSPFFDTLLVLVVSPLVTLTVVYALLLLRSRIRRRRWRAPKSLVERLPVRTYQTISESSSTATPHAVSPTTPLLQHSPSQPTSPVHSRSSNSEDEELATSSAAREAAHRREEEKRETGLAEWRRRYGGRQKECVVCLDEYVDGVSQVMSLPCGHEFHAECITPWLVTRRRTCPICKGDVVRSLAQSYHNRLPSPSPTRSTFHLNGEDDVQAQAAEMRNDSPSASLPMPISASAPNNRSSIFDDDDVEANWSGDESRQPSGDASANRGARLGSSVRDLNSTVSTVIWRGVEAVRTTTGFQRRPPEGVDRDR